MQQRANASRFTRSGIRLLHLTENVRLPKHHGIQSGCHSKEVTRTFLTFMAIKSFVSLQFLNAFGMQAPDYLFGRNWPGRRTINLNPITGRQDQCLAAPDLLSKNLPGALSRKSLARFDLGRVMANSNAKEVHHIAGFCETKLIAHKTEIAAVNANTHRTATRLGANQRQCRPCKIIAYNTQTPNAQTIFIRG